MSDFDQLLGQLKSSADRVTLLKTELSGTTSSRVLFYENPADTRRESSASGSRKKRRMNLAPCALPRDYQLLNGFSISFLIIGAQKAGTSWLDNMLRRHPNLSLPRTRKELHFWDWNRRKGLDWYAAQWDDLGRRNLSTATRGNNEKICATRFGEVTPCYAVLPENDIAEIRALFPDVKLVFIARNMVDRAWSAILMELRNANRGLKPGEFAPEDLLPQLESRTFGNRTGKCIVGNETEKVKDLSDEINFHDCYDDYFMDRLQSLVHSTRSDYATSIRRWLKFFPVKQLLIVDYSDIAQNPRKVLRHVCDHVGAISEPFVMSLRDEDTRLRINTTLSGRDEKEVVHNQSTNISFRFSLQKKMVKYLQPYKKDFDDLLQELNYDFRLQCAIDR